MSFLYPGFLWALAALALPILIHLFFFRRYKRVYFSNVRFLREIKEETDTRNRVKHLLVLLARIGAVVFLVLAFAQPFLPEEGAQMSGGQRAVSVFVDNSFSMDALAEDRSLFEKARDQARRIAEAHSPDDRFQLITSDLEGRHQRLMSREEFYAALEELQISPASPQLSRIYGRQQDALSLFGEAKRSAYLVSDFQTSAVDLVADTALPLHFLPLAGVEQRNLAIDTAWFEEPVQVKDQRAALRLRIRNYGDTDAERVHLELKVNGEMKAISEVDVEAGSSEEDTLTFTVSGEGWQLADLHITDYPVTFDDTWYLSFEVATEIPVLVISERGGNPFLNTLFGRSELFSLENRSAGNVDYAALGQNRLIVLDGLDRISSGLAAELADYLEAGGGLFVFPSENADATSYNAFLSQTGAAQFGDRVTRPREVTQLNTENAIFRDVFRSIPRNLKLPKATLSYRVLRGALSREDILMRFRDGDPFIGRYPVGMGSLYLCASPLDRKHTDLPVQGGIIVPILFKVAVLGDAHRPLAQVIGKEDWIRLDTDLRDAETQPVVRKGEDLEFLPMLRNTGDQVRIHVADQVREAGQYDVVLPSGELISRFSMNYDRKESRMEFLNREALETQFGGMGVQVLEEEGDRLAAAVGRINEGQRLWKLCLILALVFLALEILLIRFA